MHTAPAMISHQLEASDSAIPATPATPKHRKAAYFTRVGGTRPEPVSRSGPVRSSSVPRTPSE